MEFQRITTAGHAMYQRAMDLYKASFPLHEQRENDSQAGIMGEPDYQFNLLYDGGLWVGLLLFWETAAFVYVEHFCILPQMRGKNYGRSALEQLRKMGKTVVLEIDPPVDPVSVRRQSFYVRAGYQENEFAHVHPPYRKGFEVHRLVVMSSPKQLTEGEYDAFYRYLRDIVMQRETGG